MGAQKPLTVLVVGDAHFVPGQDQSRAAALGNAILEQRPDQVMIMGDWVSMDSLSGYERKGGLRLEGMRVRDDVQCGVRALDAVVGPCRKWSTQQRRHKHRTYQPVINYVEGNHEYRIVRWWENDAQMAGIFALPEEYGDRVDTYTVYGDYLWLNGVGFTHVPFNKVGPLSTSGITTSIAQKAAVQTAKSIVFGHTHIFDIGRQARVGTDETIYAVNVGCFFEPEHDPSYMEGRIKDWWRGVVWMEIDPDGRFDLRTEALDKFKARYL